MRFQIRLTFEKRATEKTAKIVIRFFCCVLFCKNLQEKHKNMLLNRVKSVDLCLSKIEGSINVI